MDKAKAIDAIERLRRTMPRNADVATVCSIAETALHSGPKPAAIAQSTETDSENTKRLAYNRYMRDAMRKWRAKQPKSSSPVKG